MKNKYSICLSSLLMTVILTTVFSCYHQKDGLDEASRWAKETLATLSLEKKVAQLVCTDISGNYLPDDDPRMQQWISLAKDNGVGGFVCYGGTPHDVALLLNRLQKEAEIPILISTDFEGGPGQQVAGASEFPSNMAFAATRDESLMYEAAKIMASEGRSMGIHLTYTPETDVSLFPDNPQESVRSFGGDIELMGRLVQAYINGFHDMGMLVTSKHFPGRGDMKAQKEFPGFNYLDKTAGELAQNEFKSIKYAVDAGIDFVMTEHIAVPSVTGGSLLPASVEPALVKGVIRDQLGFKGIITTDDLWYDHVINRFGAEEVAIKALEAGHDIILKPKNPVATIKAVTEAVKQGRLSIQQIDSSVYKLLYLKARLGLHKNRLVDENKVSQTVGTLAHQAVVHKVADRSVTLLRNEGVFPLKNWDPKHTIHITIQKDENQPFVAGLIQKTTTAFPGITTFSLKPGTCESQYDVVKAAVKKADHVVLSFLVQRTRFGDPAPVREQDLKLIRDLLVDKSKTIIAISYGNPHIINKIPNLKAFLVCYGEGGWYGNQPVYFDSFIDIMNGKLVPTGKLPIQISQDDPIGFGLTY